MNQSGGNVLGRTAPSRRQSGATSATESRSKLASRPSSALRSARWIANRGLPATRFMLRCAMSGANKNGTVSATAFSGPGTSLCAPQDRTCPSTRGSAFGRADAPSRRSSDGLSRMTVMPFCVCRGAWKTPGHAHAAMGIGIAGQLARMQSDASPGQALHERHLCTVVIGGRSRVGGRFHPSRK